MVLTCAGMSSGRGVLGAQLAAAGGSRSCVVIKSRSTDRSAFAWIVSYAEVWRTNSVAMPSCAQASSTNFPTSAVRSIKPAPEVCTVRIDDTMVSALIVDNDVRDTDLGGLMKTSHERCRKRYPQSLTGNAVDKPSGSVRHCEERLRRSNPVFRFASLMTA